MKYFEENLLYESDIQTYFYKHCTISFSIEAGELILSVCASRGPDLPMDEMLEIAEYFGFNHHAKVIIYKSTSRVKGLGTTWFFRQKKTTQAVTKPFRLSSQLAKVI